MRAMLLSLTLLKSAFNRLEVPTLMTTVLLVVLETGAAAVMLVPTDLGLGSLHVKSSTACATVTRVA